VLTRRLAVHAQNRQPKSAYEAVAIRNHATTEMSAAGVDWRMTVYGGVQHSFTHPGVAQASIEGLRYDQKADERSWREMLDLFAEVFD
jgi:dienelactone hydrolase